MDSKREQAMVGIFVLIASAVLIFTVFALTGAFGGSSLTYRAYFPFAGGLEPGATVRYSGGPKVGRVEKVQIDPKDATRLEITFSVRSSLPVKTDSHVRIMSLSPLGDNHLEVVPGTAAAPLAPSGTVLKADPFIDFNALTAKLNELAPHAQELMVTLNERATELKVTLARVNDLLSDQNRANLAGTLSEAHGMLAENRAPIRSAIQHVNVASEKLGPLLDDFRKTSAQANKTLDHVDSLIAENRPDIHQAILELRKALNNVTELTGRIDQTLEVNSDNIDELLENLRHVSQNLKEFTNTIKTRPYTLIRSSNPRDHKPGEKP